MSCLCSTHRLISPKGVGIAINRFPSLTVPTGTLNVLDRRFEGVAPRVEEGCRLLPEVEADPGRRVEVLRGEVRRRVEPFLRLLLIPILTSPAPLRITTPSVSTRVRV